MKDLKELLKKSNEKCLSIDECKELKKQLTKAVFDSNNDYIINSYYHGINNFKEEVENLNNKNLNLLDIKEVKFLNIINKINKFDLEYLFTL